MKKLILIAILLFPICNAEILEITFVRYGAVERILPTWLVPYKVPGAIIVSINTDNLDTSGFIVSLKYTKSSITLTETKTVKRFNTGWTSEIFWIGSDVSIEEINVVELKAINSKTFKVSEDK